MFIVPNTFAGLAGPEIELFRETLKDITGTGVEIGCLDGFSTVVILENSNLDQLFSIDPFIPDSMEASLVGDALRFKANTAQFNKKGLGRSHLIKDYSFNAIKDWAVPLTFLFIDGDHTYPSVKQDYDDWTPCLRKGGLLALHDARMGRPGGANFHPGPTQLAQECIFSKPDAWEIVGEAFSLVVARKK